MNLIDIHTHFLPGLDDGPRTLDETVEQLRMAHAGGTRTIVATPHMFHESFRLFDISEVEQCFAATVKDLRTRAEHPGHEFLGEMEFLLGAENFGNPIFLDALEKGRVLTLNQGRHILVEFNLNLPKQPMISVTDRILARGLIPVLAHVERYAQVRRDPALLDFFLEKGCLTQVNADSFEGSFLSRGRRFAQDLLDKYRISVIASDSHGPHYRPPQMTETFQKISSRAGEEQAVALFQTNPQWIVSR